MAKSKKIGIILYLPPALAGNELAAQGLTRHALTTAASLAKRDDLRVEVFTSRLFRNQVRALLSDLGGSSSVARVKAPLLAGPAELLSLLLLGFRKRSKRRQNRNVKLGRFLSFIFTFFLSRWTTALLFLIGGVGAVLLALLGLASIWNQVANDSNAWSTFLPFTLVAFALIVLLRLAAPRLRGGVSFLLATFFGSLNTYGQEYALAIERADVGSTVRAANRRGIRHWWIPSAMYSSLGDLRGFKVTSFADFVPIEKPSISVDFPGIVARGEQIKDVLGKSDVVVCLSDYVRTKHLPVFAGQAVENAVTISPGPPVRGLSEKQLESTVEVWEAMASEYPQSRASSSSWWDFPVLVVPTQDRPHKNLKNLALAVKIYNIQSNRRLRIVFTCDPNHNGLGKFVDEQQLYGFIEFLPNMTDALLDLVLRQANLAATPSYFEGSLPYTLFEGVSQGTPCLLAEMPVTRAALNSFESGQLLNTFDPSSPASIAKAIAFAIENTDEVLMAQRTFIDEYYRENSWENVAGRYADLFQSVEARIK